MIPGASCSASAGSGVAVGVAVGVDVGVIVGVPVAVAVGDGLGVAVADEPVSPLQPASTRRATTARVATRRRGVVADTSVMTEEDTKPRWRRPGVVGFIRQSVLETVW
ncbi:hypothetical protein DP108_04820 [Halosegnis rubeus]|uniref:Uncharacterized protein n=1 Tax=Halosegnis rubeus TaxID=2212850 RepID=A0A5N5UKZ1_9EURY|nr:hypothetical protein DP108_04820 [Halosegnis rubeus]